MLSEKCNAFSRPLKKKALQEERGTKVELYAIGTSTTLESNKSHRRLRAAIGSGEVRPARGPPALGVIWLHAHRLCPAGGAPRRPRRPRGRTRGPRGMLLLGEPGATLQDRLAGATPRVSEVGSPWP